MARIGFIEAIRRYFADPIVDQKWIRRDADPFKPDDSWALVIGVKDGWVQYRKNWGVTSCSISVFKQWYRRRRPEEICPALN